MQDRSSRGSDRVEIVEVSPRDGLQNEDILVSTEVKLELIARLVECGARRLEATSFVHPGRVPAMVDAEDVMRGVNRAEDVSYIGLVLNEKGLERAIAASCDEVNYVVAATDSFSLENQGTSVDDNVAMWGRIARRAREAGVEPSFVVSVAFGCPYEGEVPAVRVADVVGRALDAGVPDRLSLADTIGVATPRDVSERLSAIEVPEGTRLGMHFHNTRNTGIANAYSALEAGVRSFDASLGGIGGCPFAPNATGNISTEDLVFMLHRMGFDTGLDLEGLAGAARWLRGHLGESVVGLYSRAGPFPMAG